MKRICMIFFVILFFSNLHAQKETEEKAKEPKPERFSSEYWCDDQMTIAFSKSTEKRPYLSGIRLLFEPQLGQVIQTDRNKIDFQIFQDIAKFAISTNLYEGWLGFQVGIFYPDEVSYEEDSEIVEQGYLKDGENIVGLNFGYSIALDCLDGIIAVGYGRLSLDANDFSTDYDGRTHANFWFINIQPANLVRTLVKDTTDK